MSGSFGGMNIRIFRGRELCLKVLVACEESQAVCIALNAVCKELAQAIQLLEGL